MDGFAVLEALRANKTLNGIPVIVTSAQDSCVQALKIGARGFVAKPIDRQVLQTALQINIKNQLVDDHGSFQPTFAKVASG